MSPCDSCFDSRNSFKRFPITMMVSGQECYLRIAKRVQDSRYPGMILSRSNSHHEVTRNLLGEETPLGSSDTFTPTRRARYPFVATVKANGPGFRDAPCWPDDGFERRRVPYVDAKGAILRRHADSVGNREGWRCAINERYCGLQPEGPIHGNLFRGDAARSSGYPCRLDKSCNRTVNSRLTAP